MRIVLTLVLLLSSVCFAAEKEGYSQDGVKIKLVVNEIGGGFERILVVNFGEIKMMVQLYPSGGINWGRLGLFEHKDKSITALDMNNATYKIDPSKKSVRYSGQQGSEKVYGKFKVLIHNEGTKIDYLTKEIDLKKMSEIYLFKDPPEL